MSFSLNEVEALAKKATRGAGYPWGLAEDAGKAARFLCANGVDGCAALADVLSQMDGRTISNCMPNCVRGMWRTDEGVACPILLGTALSDRACEVAAGVVTTGEVAQPVLLVPFGAQIARAIDEAVCLSIGETNVVTDGRRVSISGRVPVIAEVVRVSKDGTVAHALAQTSRADPDARAWAALNALAHRTYAPATEESRRKGAG